MFVRSKDEALNVLAEILELPERTAQIVQITVRIAACLDHDARTFLVDAQAGLIEGGLEQMRKKRQEKVAALQEEEPESLIIIGTDQDELLEGVGSALDCLRMVEIAGAVFPELMKRVEPWQVGRAVLADEEIVRENLVSAVRSRSDVLRLESIQADLEKRIEAQKPEWIDQKETIRDLCRKNVEANKMGDGSATPADDYKLIYNVVAIRDEHAGTLLQLLSTSRSDALEYIDEVRKRVEVLHQAEQKDAQ